MTNGTTTYMAERYELPGIVYSIKDVGGYPTAENFLHSTDGMTNAEHDTDRDGMPNVWEEAHGLDPDDPADGAIVSLSAEDYTNVEMYLNELIGDPVVYRSGVAGDVNADGIFSSLDVITLQKWLLGAGRLPNPAVGDLCEDGNLDVFDLSVMKQKLLQS